ncbi:MAG: hypothetical protein GF418_02465 [Chitinivibrionales bacterium]|nr:hypothetical protein [Chitinivibrionales bacterium]
MLSRLSRLVGPRGQDALVRLTYPCFRSRTPLRLPADLTGARRLAVILPEDPLESLHAMSVVGALVNHFSGAEVVIACERRVAGFFERVRGIADVVAYDRGERYLYSREFGELGDMLSQKACDACVILEKNPDASLWYLIARMAPPIRIGYAQAASYPFLNVRIRTTGEAAHASDQNLLAAAVMGAKPVPPATWSVSKETIEEMRHALREYRIPEGAAVACLDAAYLYGRFGAEWTSTLVNTVREIDNLEWVIYAGDSADEDLVAWIERSGLPAFPALSPSRSAALIQVSCAVVSGKAVLFELAHLLGKPAIGVFEENEVCRYCRPDGLSHVAGFSGRPDDRTAGRVKEIIGTLAAARPGSR